jgi:hypothetical protein
LHYTQQPLELQPAISVAFPSELKQFECQEAISRAFQANGIADPLSCRDSIIILDMSATRWIDLGALLWQILQLARWKQLHNEIRIRLPALSLEDTSLAATSHERSAANVWSFLYRWGYFQTLAILVDDPINILYPEQVSYLPVAGAEPRWYRYHRASLSDDEGRLTEVLSSRLLEITNLMARDPSRLGEGDIKAYLLQLEDQILLHALARLCGWSSTDGRTFLNSILGEGLRNAALHAEAAVTLVAMRIDSRYLSLALVDDGNGIPETLRQAYHELSDSRELAGKIDGELIQLYTDADFLLDSTLIRRATDRGTTTRSDRLGMGLYYLKRTVLHAGGKLRIRSGEGCVDFSQDHPDGEVFDNRLRSAGTLLRVLIPVLTRDLKR